MFCELNHDCTECCCTHKPSVFNVLTPENKAMLFHERKEVIYKPGEMVFKQGATMTHIGCNKSGIIKLTAEAPNGMNVVLRLIAPGELFGGMGLYHDETNHASCIALTTVKVCLIPVEAFKKTLEKNQQLAIELIKRINQHAINSKNRTIELTTQSIYGRVSSLLLYLSKIIYQSNDFETNLSRQDMADLCAMAKESLIRVFKEFKEDKIIIINKNNIKIIDENKLIRFTIN
jgi:CRP-like cAMP-binding protein